MTFDGYVACICEGANERSIIDMLLNHNKLSFDREQMLENKVLIRKNIAEFQRRYLNFEYDKPVNVINIHDSRRERTSLGASYQEIVKVFNVITSPEIEILIIIAERKKNDFDKKKRLHTPVMKACQYCKGELGYKDVKSYDFMPKYFTDVELLIHTIHEYKRITPSIRDEYMLFDLLR